MRTTGLLVLGLGLAGGAAAAAAASTTTPRTACYTLADGRCVEETFHNPPVLKANAAGVYELELRPTEFLVDGKRQCGRAYNGLFPAPTIDTPAQVDGKPRQVRVDLRNLFTKEDVRTLTDGTCTCKDAAGKSCTPSHADHGGSSSSCTCVNEDGDTCHYYDFNVTNLHAHGGHVRPDYAAGGGCVEKNGLACRTCSGDPDHGSRECFLSDDVISRVPARAGAQYRWDIDEDGVHHEGLDWFHPHIHGSTAIQVASGATGAWIVRGPVDSLPGIKNARERIFVISTPPVDLGPLADGQKCDEDHITFDDFPTLGDSSKKQSNLLNGLRQPRMITPPGQVERWRFLHGSFLDEMFIAVFKGKDADCKSLDFARGPIGLPQIGRDGLTLPRPADGKEWPYAPPYVFLSPGYRVDAMLDGSTLKDGDTLCLMAGRFLQEDTSGTTDTVGITKALTLDDLLRATTNGDLLAILNVTKSAGQPTETRMPDLAAVATHAPGMTLQNGKVDALARCKEAQAVKDADKIDQLAALWTIFYKTTGFDFCACQDHNINCRNFGATDRDVYPWDRVLTLGAVDHWRLVSGFDGHPFHIHINPFLVCPLPPAGSTEPNTKGRIFEPPFAHWRDTYLVNLDRTVDVITEYRRFTGAYVYHCHKLTHEDHGMMERIKVCDPSVESCDTQCSGGKCGWNACAPGDDNCLRQLAGAKCMVDPRWCAEAALRCTPCKGDDRTCPPNATCSDTASADGKFRCLPGVAGL
jgi:FtsP/CotA-like multicopper oxidase with cupredoxin domain